MNPHPDAGAQVHRADPTLRRVALGLSLLAVLLGGVAITQLPAWVEGYLASLAGATPDMIAQAIQRLAWLCAVLIALPVQAFGLYLWWFARRVRRSGRLPPPGMRVAIDTPVLLGAAAQRRARRMRVGGALCLLLGPALGAWSFVQLVRLADLLAA